ncbi:MAG: peptide ABC transporter substrate-binding protein [Bacillota bacterium]
MRKRLSLLVISLLVLSMLAGCGTQQPTTQPSTPPAKAPDTQVMNLNLGEEPPNMDPNKSTDQVSFEILNATQEGLIRMKPGMVIEKGEGLAKDWTISPDGLTYTFTLKDGLKWSDGKAITAQDFEYGWKRALDPNTGSQYAYIMYMIKGAEALNGVKVKDNPDAAAQIKKAMDELGVKAKDEKTLVVTLERPTGYFLGLMGFGTYLPVRKDLVEKYGEKFAAEVANNVYSGPWAMKEWVHESKIVLEKNPNYWDAKNVKLEKINFVMIKDANTQMNMFEKDELDSTGVPGDFLKMYQDKGTLKRIPEATTWYILFNTKNEIFKNAKIRRAFSLAIDRKGFAEQITQGAHNAATTYTPPSLLLPDGKTSFASTIDKAYWMPETAKPDEAKKLLAEGLKELGLSTTPKFTFLSSDASVAKKYAQAFQAFWKQNLGVDVEIELVNFQVRLQKMDTANYQIAMAGWGGDYNDPQTFVDLWLSTATPDSGGNNNAFYNSPTYDKYVKDGITATETKAKYENYKKAEEEVLKDLPITPVWWNMRNYVEKTWTKGIARFPVGPDIDWKWAYIEGRGK